MLPAPQIYADARASVLARITEAAREVGRDPAAIRLLAVAKQQPAAAIRDLAAVGQVDFGENYLQEALGKIKELQDLPLIWHFIGQLQSNKSADVAAHFQWVHTVDRERIARRLSAQRPYHAPPLQVLLQVKLEDEAGKGGVEPHALADLAACVAGLPRLRLRGLMCIPPPRSSGPEQRRPFLQLRELLEGLNRAGHALDTLSMGMSADLEAAIAEGATIVRVGTALFGERR